MSSPTTFSLNDMVFIENIGYGTVLDCGKSKSVSLKQIPSTYQRRQSIYFDPDLFNSEAQTLARQKSQAAVLVPSPKIQNKIAKQQNIQQPPTIQQQNSSNQIKQEDKKLPEEPIFNIVKIKLQGTSALVYTSDQHIRKHVVIPIRPLFAPALGTINIKIEIGKTIQSLKRQIFDLLGLKHSHYFNVKLFTTSPTLNQLNNAAKTIWQYGLRESSVLTMTAEHGFCFQTIPPHLTQYFNLLNNNLTLVNLPKKPKVVSNIVIALPPSEQAQTLTVVPVPQTQPPQSPVKNNNAQKQATQPNGQIANKTQQKIVVQQKKEKVQEVKQQKKVEKQIEPPEISWINGDRIMRSGKQYFEVRLDKLPQNNAHLRIGITSQCKTKKWYYSPLLLQKVYEENQEVKSTENYGMIFKQNDVVGVLTRIDKHKNMKVNFFKNNINLGLCFEAHVNQIAFTFAVGSEGQISLDTRAQFPVDSYRFR